MAGCTADLSAPPRSLANAPAPPDTAVPTGAAAAESGTTTTVTSTPTANAPPATTDDPFGDQGQTTGVIGVLHAAP